MSLSIKAQGDYRLYETRDRHRKLLILDKKSYEWIADVRDDILVLSHQAPREDSLIGYGRYRLVRPKNEPGWEDGMEYLALSDSEDRYYLYKLPESLPMQPEQRRPIFGSTRTVEAEVFLQAEASGLT